MMTYAPEHEKELLNRSYRCRMEVPPVLRPGSEAQRATQDPQHSRDPKCRLLCVEEWLSLATSAPQLPTLGERLPLV